MGVKGLLAFLQRRIQWDDERRASVGEYGKCDLPPSLLRSLPPHHLHPLQPVILTLFSLSSYLPSTSPPKIIFSDPSHPPLPSSFPPSEYGWEPLAGKSLLVDGNAVIMWLAERAFEGKAGRRKGGRKGDGNGKRCALWMGGYEW